MSTTPLTIGDGSGWHFVNGAWTDGDGGALTVPPDLLNAEMAPLQGAHFAFDRTRAYQDCRISFDFLLRGHSDAGIILRARDESHFYLVHFPNCGQASRAQHFWVALSKMDDAGYLTLIKLEMVPRVPSTNGIPLHCEITLQGDRFTVRVGDYGRFEACDGTYRGPGAAGAYLFGKAELANVRVQGQATATSWRSGFEHPTNWWHPLPAGPGYWQQPVDMKRFDDGELLMLMNVQDDTSAAMTAHAQPFLTRSDDDGRTWSELQPLGLGELASSWAPARMHLTPRGRLIAMLPGTDHKLVYESGDRGRTWTEGGTTNLHVGPPKEPPVQSLAPMGFLNLADGAVLSFLLLGKDMHDNPLSLHTWGSWHCQAFCARSDDDGATWNAAVNVDTPGFHDDGTPMEGNLDLTECTAVQLGNGRVVAYMRPIYSHVMWESWSDDGGTDVGTGGARAVRGLRLAQHGSDRLRRAADRPPHARPDPALQPRRRADLGSGHDDRHRPVGDGLDGRGRAGRGPLRLLGHLQDAGARAANPRHPLGARAGSTCVGLLAGAPAHYAHVVAPVTGDAVRVVGGDDRPVRHLHAGRIAAVSGVIQVDQQPRRPPGAAVIRAEP